MMMRLDSIGLIVLMNGTGADNTFFTAFFLFILIAFYTAQIISGFISFGTLHINTKGFEPWQW